jgi:hypothetical protein
MNTPVASPCVTPARTRWSSLEPPAPARSARHTAGPPAIKKMPNTTASTPDQPSPPSDSSSTKLAISAVSSGPEPRASG